MKNKPELLAPVGDFVSLRAALKGGCDAVYLGVAGMNMRQNATNFSLSDISEVHRICRDANIRIYLTLNTIVYPHEHAKICEILEVAKSKVDGVICWDPLVICECRRRQMPIHVSTQASVSNPEAARMYADLGAVRVVPARECTLDELQTIRSESGLELEVFVHGAMCVSVSGRCFLSDFVCGKSGNRGECTQNCRRQYEIRDVEDGHEFTIGNHFVMSAKDLCTLPFIDVICDTGVDALKIEGRGRNPEYVQTVVSAYRRAIDAWADDALCSELKKELLAKVEGVYNRTFCKGFFFGRPISDFIDASGSQARYTKEFVGRITNYYRKLNVAEVEVLDNTFGKGDPLLIIGETTGVVSVWPKEIRQCETDVDVVERGKVTIPLASRVRVGDRVYRQVERPVDVSRTRG
ncbi:MAG: U32 family peptidase [Deltaproteobacteria bacterium]|nr:U32 family peptidase [Deltaproteobacteria bacterium]